MKICFDIMIQNKNILFWTLLLILVNSITCEDFELIILHNNDMHARFEGNEGIGGFGRTSQYIKDQRAKARRGEIPPVIYLNAGDTFTGTTWFTIHRWKIASAFIEALHPDVMSLGNHEFDEGVDNLTAYLRSITVPTVCANCIFILEPEAGKIITPYHILEINDRKIGVIGYLTPDTEIAANIRNVAIENEVDAVRKYAQELVNDGINIIIAVGHSGFETDISIAREIAEVDIVIGGHTNTFLWHDKFNTVPGKEKAEGKYPYMVKKRSGNIMCPVVTAYAYTKYLGHLRVIFNEQGELKKVVDNESYVLYMNQSFKEDEIMLSLLENYRAEVDYAQNKVVGNTQVTLDAEHCRKAECNIANMILDAFVDYKTSMYTGKVGWTDCPIAIVNAGAVRSTIFKGPVTLGHLLTTMPFFQKLISFTITGEILKKTLEKGVRNEIPRVEGEFIHVSGIHYIVDRNKPVNQRIKDVRVRCGTCRMPIYEPLRLHKRYRLITIVFLANGGDGHTALHERTDSVIEDVYDTEVVQKYLQYNIYVRPEIEERISYPRPTFRTSYRNSNISPNTDKYVVYYCIIICIFTLYNVIL